MVKQKLAGKLFGIFFIFSFLSYGIGAGLLETELHSLFTQTSYSINKLSFRIGGILMAVLHGIFNIFLALIAYKQLKIQNHLISDLYWASALFSTLTLTIGGCLLLSNLGLETHLKDQNQVISFARFTFFANFYCYQIGMCIWGIGGLALSYLLKKAKAIPNLFALWGYWGYSIFMIGTIAEISGFPIGIYCSIIGGLFEITLSIYLIIKGFPSSDQN